MKTLFVLTLIFFSISGYSQNFKQEDSIARNLSPIENKAIVYILRPTSFGAPIDMDVHCDSTFLGTTHANSYLYTILAPGMYIFRSKAENKSELPLELESGKIYFIEQSVKMGIVYARANLKLAGSDEGRKFMKKCKLSKDNKFQVDKLISKVSNNDQTNALF